MYEGAIESVANVCIVCVARDMRRSRGTMSMMLMLIYVQYLIGYSIKREEKFEEGRKQKRHDE